MNPLVQNFITQTINSLLSKLRQLFPNGELAYYSLQGKNELQIRDRVAWELQQALDTWQNSTNRYIVRREWGPYNRTKCDLAVLEVDPMDTNRSELVALFEFKACQFVNDEKWLKPEFFKDTYKMYNMCSSQKGNNDVDMYFIFLHSCQSDKQVNSGFRDAVAYVDILNDTKTLTLKSHSMNDITSKMQTIWREFFNTNNEILYALIKSGKKVHSQFKFSQKDSPAEKKAKTLLRSYLKRMGNLYSYPTTNISFPNPIPQHVGSSFGYDWYVAPFIWGPYKIDLQAKKNCLITLK